MTSNERSLYDFIRGFEIGSTNARQPQRARTKAFAVGWAEGSKARTAAFERGRKYASETPADETATTAG